MLKHTDLQSKYWHVQKESSNAEKMPKRHHLSKMLAYINLEKCPAVPIAYNPYSLSFLCIGFVEGVQEKKRYNTMVLSLSGMSNI